MIRPATIVLVFVPTLANANLIEVEATGNGAGKGPYAAIGCCGTSRDDQTSIGYNVLTGEVFVDVPVGKQLTSLNIESASGIFTGAPARNLGGSFDNDTDHNIFKATFGSSFGSLSFGNVAQAQPGLSEQFVMGDLTVIGSLAGGGGLGAVDLFAPEPNSLLLALTGLTCLAGLRRCTGGFNYESVGK